LNAEIFTQQDKSTQGHNTDNINIPHQHWYPTSKKSTPMPPLFQQANALLQELHTMAVESQWQMQHQTSTR
jgi:hypothetical protein